MSFFAELRRRHVLRVAAWYAAGAWVVIQVASTVIPQFNLPAWAVRAVIVAAVAGFPVALLLAWAFDLTRAGITWATPAPLEQTAASPVRGLVSLLSALAAGVLLTIGAITGWHVLEAPAGKPGIAVLAFDVLGQNANQALAGGLQEAVLDELAHLSGLRVIARTSVLRFADTKPDMREVGRILDVPYVLEGSLQREGGQLRVHAQLIDTASNEHVWSETYDRAADDIFGMQTALAHDIAERLRVTLLPSEIGRAGAPPTAVPAAYEAFLNGLSEFGRYQAILGESGLASLRAALAAMDQALALDPAFALAHAERARILMELWWNFRGREADADDASERALLAVTEALRLAPDLGEAHRALALYYYWGLLDYPSAERELARAHDLLPNDSVSVYILGLVRRRQNRYNEAIDLFRDAYRLNPSDQSAREMYALGLYDMGRWAEADAVMADLLARFPEAPDPLFGRALLSFCRTGETDSLRAAAAAGLSNEGMDGYARWLAARYEGHFEEALTIVLAGSGDDFGFTSRPEALAESYYYANDDAAVAAAQVVIDFKKAQVQAEPDKPGVYLGLADAYLIAGEADKARQAAHAYLDSTPLKKAALEYWEARRATARTYAALGDTEQALQLLALVQHGPSHPCGNELRRDPMYASLLDDPRFKQIAADSDWK